MRPRFRFQCLNVTPATFFFFYRCIERIFLSCLWVSQDCDLTLVNKDPPDLSPRQLLPSPNWPSLPTLLSQIYLANGARVIFQMLGSDCDIHWGEYLLGECVLFIF